MIRIFFHFRCTTSEDCRVAVDWRQKDGVERRFELTHVENNIWEGCLILLDNVEHLNYNYILLDGKNEEIHEEEIDRSLRLEDGDWTLADTWNLLDFGIWYVKSLLHCLVGDRCANEVPLFSQKSNCVLRLVAVPPPSGWTYGLFVTHENPNCDNPLRMVEMVRTCSCEWQAEIQLEKFNEKITYRYVLFREDGRGTDEWNLCPECSVVLPLNRSRLVVTDVLNDFPKRHWKAAGVCVPVSALRRCGGTGIGDFEDLRRLVIWASETGLRIVQILPVTLSDTVSPYSMISPFALHPQYLSLHEWVGTESFTKVKSKFVLLEALPETDFGDVGRVKMEFLLDVYLENRFSANIADYSLFCEKNSFWLDAYAADFSAHPPFSADILKEKTLEAECLAEFARLLQFHLHRQLLEVGREASRRGVMLKGDLPYGVSRCSLETIQNKMVFSDATDIGVPPDCYSPLGHNWGLAAYSRGDKMKYTNEWWRLRLEHFSHYFDACRLDHVYGFFRTWEIPRKHGLAALGHFSPSYPLKSSELVSLGFNVIKQYTVPHFDNHFIEEKEREGLHVRDFLKIDSNGDWVFVYDLVDLVQILSCLPSSSLKDCLMEMTTDVLFVPDEKEEAWHPKFCAWQTNSYRRLSHNQREAYDSLCNYYFGHLNLSLWTKTARNCLSHILNDCNMVVCAEDLGLGVSGATEMLKSFHVLGLEIERMPKVPGLQFGRVVDNDYLSVATTSTHDMLPLRLWWKEDRDAAQNYWNHILKREGSAPQELAPECCREIVEAHLSSSSIFCVIPLQDLLAIHPQTCSPHPERECINRPGMAKGNWSYRMHLTIDELSEIKDFSDLLVKLLEKHGR